MELEEEVNQLKNEVNNWKERVLILKDEEESNNINNSYYNSNSNSRMKLKWKNNLVNILLVIKPNDE